MYIIGTTNTGVKVIRPGSTVITNLSAIVFPDDFGSIDSKYYCECDDKLIGIRNTWVNTFEVDRYFY